VKLTGRIYSFSIDSGGRLWILVSSASGGFCRPSRGRSGMLEIRSMRVVHSCNACSRPRRFVHLLLPHANYDGGGTLSSIRHLQPSALGHISLQLWDAFQGRGSEQQSPSRCNAVCSFQKLLHMKASIITKITTEPAWRSRDCPNSKEPSLGMLTRIPDRHFILLKAGQFGLFICENFSATGSSSDPLVSGQKQ